MKKKIERSESSYRFRSLTSILTTQGFNYWDARIEARKLLGIKGPYDAETWKGSRRTITVNVLNGPSTIPTDEDRLELYLLSIVATCKSVIHGTAVFRSLSEYSTMWQDFNDFGMMKKNHSKYVIKPEPEKKNYYTPLNRPKGYWKMVRILEASGLSLDDARVKAELLLTKDTN